MRSFPSITRIHPKKAHEIKERFAMELHSTFSNNEPSHLSAYYVMETGYSLSFLKEWIIEFKTVKLEDYPEYESQPTCHISQSGEIKFANIAFLRTSFGEDDIEDYGLETVSKSLSQVALILESEGLDSSQVLALKETVDQRIKDEA